MNSLRTPENQNESDLFRSLLQMRSPFSMNAVKNYVFEHIGQITIWQRIQRLIFQTGALMTIIVSISCINSPAGENKISFIHPPSNNMSEQIADDTSYNVNSGIRDAEMRSSGTKIILEHPAAPEEMRTPNIPIPVAAARLSVIDPETTGVQDIILPKEPDHSSVRPFVEIQGITSFDHARMYGSGVSAGIIHDWQIVTVHFMDAAGTRDDKKDNSSLQNVSRITGESGEQAAIMFGGIIERGRLSTSLQLGPSYTLSAITSGTKGILSSNTVLNQRLFGVSAQISAGYTFSNVLSANVEGFYGYRSAFSKGIMVSLRIQP